MQNSNSKAGTTADSSKKPKLKGQAKLLPSPMLGDVPNPWLGNTCKSNFCVHNCNLICRLKLKADWCGGYIA